MHTKFYLDTAILRDYMEDRGDGIRPLGEFAFRFLRDCEINECKVLYSELVLHELRRDYSDDKINEMLAPFRELLIKVEISNEQIIESKKVKLERTGIPGADILHALIARDNKAILVARDWHFEHLRDIAEIMKPEEIIF